MASLITNGTNEMTIKNAKAGRARNQRGTLLLDLSVACIILIAFAVLALDCGGAIMAFGMTDRACRDAARAAAQGSNPTEARQLANAIIRTYATSSGILSSPRVDNVTYTDFGGHPPDGSSPFVTVTTSASARVLAPLSFFGRDLVSGSFPMRKTYTFPIVKLDVDS